MNWLYSICKPYTKHFHICYLIYMTKINVIIYLFNLEFTENQSLRTTRDQRTDQIVKGKFKPKSLLSINLYLFTVIL